MRIIGGKFRSRRVHSTTEPNNCIKGNVSGYRPTTDRARETLFNVLNNIIDFDMARSLDLFAGSGAIGFELISRGAASCDFVENAHKQISNIQKTAGELGCVEQVNIINENVIGFLKRSGTGLGFYDIIFADPPYGYEFYNELMQGVLNMKFGIFVLEHAGESTGMFNVTELNSETSQENEPAGIRPFGRKPVRNDFDIIEKKVGMTIFTILIKKD